MFFLKSNLRLSLRIESSKVFNSFSSKIAFLGMVIYNVSTKRSLYFRGRKIEDKKLKCLRVLSRLKALKHKQTKIFKNECLAFLRNSYNMHRNRRAIFQRDFISLIESSTVFKNLFNRSNRSIYREFLKDLQWLTDVRDNHKLVDFLKL